MTCGHDDSTINIVMGIIIIIIIIIVLQLQPSKTPRRISQVSDFV